MAEFDFDNFFKLQMMAMKFMQCHPNTKLDKYWVLKNLIGIGTYTLYFILLTNCMKWYISKNDYYNAFRNGVPVLYYVCMMLYYCLLIKHQTTLDNLINSMKNDYAKACDMETRRKTIIHNTAAKGQKIMKIWFVLMIATVVVFIVKSMCLTIYQFKRHGELKLIPFYEMHYPLNLTERREHDKMIFAATFVAEMNFTTICVAIFFCSVPLGPIFMLHACGQLELIIVKFENVFGTDNVDGNLNDIIQNLQYIYSFVSEINKCFTFVYEVMLKQNMLLLPCTAYAIIQSISLGEMTIEYASVLMQGLFTSSIPCYYGDLLLQKGEEVRLAAYNCGWERVHKPNARKTLLIIMTRAMKPVAIETIFSTICLDTLTDVYRQAYAIFNLMTAMW